MTHNTLEVLHRLYYLEGTPTRIYCEDHCEDLGIFDWWKDTLSKKDIATMINFLEKAHAFGFIGYVCFKVGAEGCSNGMWAFKEESTTGHSPDTGACLYRSFTPSYTRWDIRDKSGKWVGGDYLCNPEDDLKWRDIVKILEGSDIV